MIANYLKRFFLLVVIGTISLTILAPPQNTFAQNENYVSVEQDRQLSGTDWLWTHDPATDTMRLFSDAGLQTEMPRPRLAGEAVDAAQSVEFIITRDSQTMLMVVPRFDDRYEIGIYSFGSGTWLNTLTTALDEQPFTGFLANSAHQSPFSSGYIPLALRTRNTDGSARLFDWRLVTFDTATGDISSTLTHADASMIAASSTASVAPEAYDFAFPIVDFSNLDVYFHLELSLEGTPVAPYFVWRLDTGDVSYIDTINFPNDREFVTGITAFLYLDTTVPAQPQTGFAIPYNVVRTKGGAAGEVNEWEDGSTIIRRVRYGNSPQWILIRAGIDLAAARWSVIDTSTNIKIDLDSSISDVMGGQTGFWSLSSTGLTLHPEVTPASGTTLYSGDVTQWNMIWALAPDSTFGLSSVATPVIEPTPTVSSIVGTVVCDDTPPTQLSVGIRGRVTIDARNPAPLRVRAVPGGEVIENLPEGTAFDIVGGPQCLSPFTWWQIELDDGRIGWSAEGDDTNYYIEPAP